MKRFLQRLRRQLPLAGMGVGSSRVALVALLLLSTSSL